MAAVPTPFEEIFCTYIHNVDFFVNTPSGLQSAGVVDQCLCYDQLLNFLQFNVVGKKAVQLAGYLEAYVDLTAFQTAQFADAATCGLPAHAVTNCTPRNLCRWRCIDGYSPYPFINPTNCICRSPKVECGGKCQRLASCPSQVVMKNKKRRVALADGDILEQESYKWWEGATCAEGSTPCGIYEGDNNGWDCVDTEHDLESCGGCTIPLHDGSPHGQDCTAISGVSDVACMAGQCVVYQCQKGYNVAEDGMSCVPYGEIPGFTLP